MVIRSFIISILIHLAIIGGIIYFYDRLEDKRADLSESPITTEIISREPTPIKSRETTPSRRTTPIEKPSRRTTPIQSRGTTPSLPIELPQTPIAPPVGGRGTTPIAPPIAVVAPPIIGDIFDADIIERQSAKRYAPDDTGNITLPDFEDTSKGGVTLQVDNMRYYGYLQRLKESIQGRWIYPKSDQQKGNYGDVILEFTINKDGSLSAVRLIRTSGHRSLDEAAMDSIKNAAPFWALPDDWHAKTFTIKGHFVYVLNPYGY